MKVPQLFRAYRVRSIHHQVLGILIHGEHDDFPYIRFVGQQHDDAIDARSDTAVRRSAVFQRIDQSPEALVDFGALISGDLERAVHDLGVMVANCAR